MINKDKFNILLGIDLCACVGGHQLKCYGICRKNHKVKGKIYCPAVYKIEEIVHPEKSKKFSKKRFDKREICV